MEEVQKNENGTTVPQADGKPKKEDKPKRELTPQQVPALLHLLRGKFPFGFIFLFRLPVRLRCGRAVLILLYFFHIAVCLTG